MTSNLPALDGATRCVIYRKNPKIPLDPNKSLKDVSTQARPIIAQVVQLLSGNMDQVIILVILISPEKEFIVFDYDNESHERCDVRGFSVWGSKIKPVSVPALYVYETVEIHKSFPRLVYLPPLDVRTGSCINVHTVSKPKHAFRKGKASLSARGKGYDRGAIGRDATARVRRGLSRRLRGQE